MNPQGEQQSGVQGHERKDADVIGLLMIAGLLFLLLAICFLVAWGVLHRLNLEQTAKDWRSTAPPTPLAKAFSKPNLLVHPGEEWAAVQATARRQLNTYGWVNRPAGEARIPIERAMELLFERGLPEVGAGQTRLQLMQARPQTDLQPNEPITSPAPEATP